MRRGIALVLSLSLFGCGSTLRPLTTTDAATSLEQVTRSSDSEFDPAISPDGNAVAYDASSNNGRRRVEVMSLATRRLVYSAPNASEPAWMPDASSIVFVDGASRPKIVQTFGMGARSSVFLADVGDFAFAASQPAVSPNGNLVAISLDDLTVRRSSSSNARRYDQAIGVSDLLGSGLKVIGRGVDPAFSPDGAFVAYSKSSGGHEHVFVAHANGSDATQITQGPDDDHSPTFSPDGSAIVFCSTHVDADGPRANLFVVHRDGSGLVQLTEGDHQACHPSWSRDGFVYFHANAGRRFHVWRLRPRTGSVR